MGQQVPWPFSFGKKINVDSLFPDFPDLTWPLLTTCFETDMFLGIIETTPLTPLYFLSILQTPHIHFIPLQLTPQGPSLYPWPHPSSLHLTFLENPTPGPLKTLPSLCLSLEGLESLNTHNTHMGDYFHMNLQPQLAPPLHLCCLCAWICHRPSHPS